jgi:hypothetical protein
MLENSVLRRKFGPEGRKGCKRKHNEEIHNL